MYDIAIIGSGPAGLTAAIYAARGNVKVCVIEGNQPGGQLMLTSSIENYPGIIDSGWGLISKMKDQAKSFDVEFISEHVQGISQNRNALGNIDASCGFTLHCQRSTIQATVVIIATGSSARWLGLPGEKELASTCATCDGFAYKGKDVVVIGGGNTAVEDAIYLANLCNKVTLIHRRDSLRAEKILQSKLFSLSNVEFRWNVQVTELIANGNQLQSVRLDDNSLVPADGAFIAIGHIPNTSFIDGLVETDESGYIKALETNVKGIFAAGDVMDSNDRQAVTAAAYGCTAARKALHYLAIST